MGDGLDGAGGGWWGGGGGGGGAEGVIGYSTKLRFSFQETQNCEEWIRFLEEEFQYQRICNLKLCCATTSKLLASPSRDVT